MLKERIDVREDLFDDIEVGVEVITDVVETEFFEEDKGQFFAADEEED